MLADSETFGTSPDLLAADPAGGCSCDTCDTTAEAGERRGEAAAASCC